MGLGWNARVCVCCSVGRRLRVCSSMPRGVCVLLRVLPMPLLRELPRCVQRPLLRLAVLL